MTTHFDSDLEQRIATALAERADSLPPSTSRHLVGEMPTQAPFVERASPRSRSRRRVLAAAAIIAAALVVFVAVGHNASNNRIRIIAPPTASSPPRPAELQCPLSGTAANGKTYGAVPASGSSADTPDFLAVTSDGRRVGFLNPSPDQSDAARSVVYGCNLTTVVGHLVPNKGFIPIGVDPATVSTLANPQDLQHADQCIEQRKPLDCTDVTSSFVGQWHVHGEQLAITSNVAGVVTGNCGPPCVETDDLSLALSPDGTRMTVTIATITFKDENTGKAIPDPDPADSELGDSFSLQFVAPHLMKKTVIRSSLSAADRGNPYWCGEGLAPSLVHFCGA